MLSGEQQVALTHLFTGSIPADRTKLIYNKNKNKNVMK